MAECVKSERCGMAKKLIVVALAVVAVAIVLKKTDLGGHVKHWWHNTRNDVNEEVSIKWEIDVLTDEVKDLEKEDATLVNLIAKEDVEIKKLKNKLDVLEENQKHNREVLRTQTSQVSDDKQLEETLRLAKRSDEAVKAQKDLIESRETRVAGLRQQRESLYTTQQELLNKLAELEARLVKIEVDQMKNPDPTDKSKVANIRRRIEALDTRIEVKEHEKTVRAELKPLDKANANTNSVSKKNVKQDALNYLNDVETKGDTNVKNQK